MKYRPEIDGLRAVAVLPVVFYHAGFAFASGGYVGVDVFFVISGYLISTIILDDLRSGRFSILQFYDRRVRRILPALFLVMICCLPFGWAWMTPDQFTLLGRSIAAVVLISSNILFWRSANYFAPTTKENPLIHTWSLAVEEQFYVIFPLVLILLWRFWKGGVGPAIVLGAIVSFLLAEFGNELHRGFSQAFGYFMLPTRAWQMMVGALAALYGARLTPANGRVRDALSVIGLLLIGAGVVVYDDNTPFPGVYALAPTLGTAAILLCARAGDVAARILSLRPVVSVGLVSYSFYLWHQPLFAFARIRSYGEPSPTVMLGLAIASLALAYLSWRYVETPFRDRRRIDRSAIFRLSGVAAAALLAIGIAAHATQGFPGRLTPETRALFAAIDSSPAHGGACMQSAGANEHRRADCIHFDHGAVRWAVLGNSFAPELAYALGERLQLSGERVLQLSAAGCVPEIGFRLANPVLSYCKAWLDEALARLLDDPEIGTVVIAYRHLHDPFDVVEGVDAAEKTALYRRGFETLIDTLRASGKRVLVLLPVPELPGDIRTLILRHGPGLNIASHPVADYRDEFEETAEWLRAVAGGDVIDPAPIFCGEQSCYGVRDGVPLFFDDNHPSLSAARRIIASAF